MVKRKGINKGNMPKLDEACKVTELLEKIEDILSMDLEIRGYELRLYDPEKNKIHGGSLLKNVRKLKPKEGEAKRRSLNLFVTILEDYGVEDIDLIQAGRLYDYLNDLLNYSLDACLIKNEKVILSD